MSVIEEKVEELIKRVEELLREVKLLKMALSSRQTEQAQEHAGQEIRAGGETVARISQSGDCLKIALARPLDKDSVFERYVLKKIATGLKVDVKRDGEKITEVEICGVADDATRDKLIRTTKWALGRDKTEGRI